MVDESRPRKEASQDLIDVMALPRERARAIGCREAPGQLLRAVSEEDSEPTRE
jgi:hypothetical protein